MKSFCKQMLLYIALGILALLNIVVLVLLFTRKAPTYDDTAISNRVKNVETALDSLKGAHSKDIADVKSSINTANSAIKQNAENHKNLLQYTNTFALSVPRICPDAKDTDVLSPLQVYNCAKKIISNSPFPIALDHVEIKSTQYFPKLGYSYISTFVPIANTMAPLIQIRHTSSFSAAGPMTRASSVAVKDLKPDSVWSDWIR